MSNYSKLYWLTRLDGINGFFIALDIISGVLILAIIIGCFISSDFDEYKKESEIKIRKELRQKIRKKIPLLSVLLSLGIIISIFTPTKNEAIFIMAGGKTMDYVQSDTSLSKMPYQATKIISDYLQKQIDGNKK